MSVAYRAVNWSRQKKRYDAILGAGVLLSLAAFAAGTLATHPDATAETILIRGLGLTGFLLLHLVLAIGPLARLDRRFLPLLYNRRHLGVTLGLVVLGHAGLVVFQYHALGDVDPLVSVLTANRDWTSLADFPFEWLGIAALAILFLMAATSHDYWMSILTPPVWKRLHMLVYLAYVALVLHVGLGFLQDERHPVYLIVVAVGAIAIGGLHLAAGLRERKLDEEQPEPDWVDVIAADAIPEGRAKIRTVAGERVAVFRHEGRLSCVSNVCKHQNGPLGEGRIIDGCITCPWHGYQYRPDDGTSPPPFNDSVPTFGLKIVNGRVLVASRPNPPGTRVEPVPVTGPGPADASEFYVGYFPEAPPALARFLRATVVTILLLSAGLMAVFAVAQRTYAAATFDFGNPTTLSGVVRESPWPVLEMEGDGGRIRRYLLAGRGKHGAGGAVAGLGGRVVRIAGTLAHRDHLTLLEIASLTPVDTAAAVSGEAPIKIGRFDLGGEIVDSKCYTGVMNPGLGKTHRGCAARCLAGGMTPLFVTRNSTGTVLEMILVDSSFGPLPPLGDQAGKRLVLSGQVWRQDDLWFFQVASPVRAGRAATPRAAGLSFTGRNP